MRKSSPYNSFYSFKVLFTIALCVLTFSQANAFNLIQKAGPTSEVHLCLTMIVKNESAIIERCLDSVKDDIDCICICDTGSTDNTVEIIEKYMQKHSIPGEVHHHSWKNFGHNRTLSAQAAQQTLKKFGFPLDTTYLLLIDADMVLAPHPEFDRNQLTEDAYLLMQKNNSLSYYNVRLVRASLPWECVGVTHEYWSAKDHHQRIRLDTLYIDDRDDGGCKSDKFERDIKLLTQGLIDEPDNERYLFYLAQSYRCINDYDEAIKWYKARIEKGGWKEEVWFSKYMIAQCYDEQGDWENALAYFLDAYNFNPDRAEPLHKIAVKYRKEGKNDLAYMFAKQGARIPYPKDQMLFVEHGVYDYQFDEEISIAAYYTGFKEDGFNSINNLILNKKAPGYIKESAYKNSLFYVSTIRSARLDPIVINLPKIRQGFPETFCPMNPSIQRTENGYMVLCRTVNYIQFGGRDHKSCDIFDPTIRTKNFLVEYDKKFNVISQKEIVENLPRYRKQHVLVEGLEDCRLISYNNSWWITCTGFDFTSEGVPQIALCKLDSKTTDNKVPVTQLTVLQGPDKRRCEKNWLPFVKNNEIHVVYSYDPFIVFKPNIQTGECPKTISIIPNYDFSAFRGSAPPIEFDDGYLLIVHEVVFSNNNRYYLHRLVQTDKDFNVTLLSKPFTFLHQGIEYTCGMTLDHSHQNLIIALGIEDRNAYLCTVDIDTIRSMLEPLPKQP